LVIFRYWTEPSNAFSEYWIGLYMYIWYATLLVYCCLGCLVPAILWHTRQMTMMQWRISKQNHFSLFSFCWILLPYMTQSIIFLLSSLRPQSYSVTKIHHATFKSTHQITTVSISKCTRQINEDHIQYINKPSSRDFCQLKVASLIYAQITLN